MKRVTTCYLMVSENTLECLVLLPGPEQVSLFQARLDNFGHSWAKELRPLVTLLKGMTPFQEARSPSTLFVREVSLLAFCVSLREIGMAVLFAIRRVPCVA